MPPLFQLPPSDVAPKTNQEWRAAFQERTNEAGMMAEALYRALQYQDSEDAIENLRNLLRLIESMRIALEVRGVTAPTINFVDLREEDDDE